MSEPYDADHRCPKCWGEDVSTSYRENSHAFDCRRHSRGWASTGDDCEVCKDEHFHRHCRRCSYEWREEVPA